MPRVPEGREPNEVRVTSPDGSVARNVSTERWGGITKALKNQPGNTQPSEAHTTFFGGNDSAETNESGGSPWLLLAIVGAAVLAVGSGGSENAEK
jgi:hypothetical protein